MLIAGDCFDTERPAALSLLRNTGSKGVRVSRLQHVKIDFLGCFSRSVPDLVFRCAIGRGQSTVRRVAERGNQANAQFLAARIDLIGLAGRVEEALRGCEKPITVAVMGCVVNGPGEAREADVGIAGGDGCGYLFVKGVPKCKVPAERMLDELLALIDTL